MASSIREQRYLENVSLEQFTASTKLLRSINEAIGLNRYEYDKRYM